MKVAGKPARTRVGTGGMQLTTEQLERFRRDGFLVIEGLFGRDEANRLRARLPDLFSEDTPANIREKASGEVRTAMGLHERDALFAALVRDPRLVEPAEQLSGEPVYIQQVKVNVKSAFSGEVWQWHYDFATHHSEDGVPEPYALNLHVFLDDVTEFNGPLYFIPGSHRRGPAPCLSRHRDHQLPPVGGGARARGRPGGARRHRVGDRARRDRTHLRRQPGARLSEQHVAVGPAHLLGNLQPGVERTDASPAPRLHPPS